MGLKHFFSPAADGEGWKQVKSGNEEEGMGSKEWELEWRDRKDVREEGGEGRG